MPKNSPERKGISPENWHYLNVVPKVGSLMNHPDLSFRGANEKEKENKNVDTLRETEVGLVEFHTDENGFGILAEELGIGLFYNNSGKLVDAGIDLLKFCASSSDEDLVKMGGEAMLDILEDVVEDNKQFLFSFDFRDNTVAVVDLDKRTGNGPILAGERNVNMNESNLMTVGYNGNKLCVAFHQDEDIFFFGLYALAEGEEFIPGTRLLVSRILTDCNYKTYLNSDSPEKYKKLADRVFFVGH